MRATIWFTQPGARLSLNDRMHYMARARLTKRWREAAGWGAVAAHCRRLGPCSVQVEFPVPDPGRRRDPHNLAPTVKAIIDGLVDAGVWPDDTPEWVTVLDPTFRKCPAHTPSNVKVYLTPRATP